MKKLNGLFPIPGTVTSLSLHWRGEVFPPHPLFPVVHKQDKRRFWLSLLYVFVTGPTTPKLQTAFHESFPCQCILTFPSYILIPDYISLPYYIRKTIELLYTVHYIHIFITITIFFPQDAAKIISAFCLHVKIGNPTKKLARHNFCLLYLAVHHSAAHL